MASRSWCLGRGRRPIPVSEEEIVSAQLSDLPFWNLVPLVVRQHNCLLQTKMAFLVTFLLTDHVQSLSY